MHHRQKQGYVPSQDHENNENFSLVVPLGVGGNGRRLSKFRAWNPNWKNLGHMKDFRFSLCSLRERRAEKNSSLAFPNLLSGHQSHLFLLLLFHKK
jgi:hypothetical protein